MAIRVTQRAIAELAKRGSNLLFHCRSGGYDGFCPNDGQIRVNKMTSIIYSFLLQCYNSSTFYRSNNSYLDVHSVHLYQE